MESGFYWSVHVFNLSFILLPDKALKQSNALRISKEYRKIIWHQATI